MADIMKRRYKVGNIDGKSNYHTHTFYCDGKNSPEEMVERALELGFTSLGFSGHQFSVPDADYAMDPIGEIKYKNHIKELQEEYKDRIKIYLGIERDYYCDLRSGYQYVIGSTHHIEKDGHILNVDESPQVFEKAVKECFQGDYMAFVEEYYKRESQVLLRTGGQIVGHFDLVTVFNKDNRYFNEEDSVYKAMALKAVDEILESFSQSGMSKEMPEDFPEELAMLIYATGLPIFEINTGATAKGRRDLPYPAPFIIEHLADSGVPLIMNSDCHDKRYLDFGFKALVNRYGE